MFLTHLKLRDFRNLSQFSHSFSEKTVVFEGQNGAGKTNLLEAVYSVATGKSFRTNTARELLRHGTETAIVEADIVREEVRHHIRIAFGPKKRVITRDDTPIRSLGELLGTFNAVAFFPEHLSIIKEGPEGRRRFLDRFVANTRPEYFGWARQYFRALKSRNLLLKAPSVPEKAELSVYDTILADTGIKMHKARVAALACLAPRAERYVHQILGTSDGFACTLSPGWKGEDLQTAFGAALSRDLRFRATSVGPHRADLEFRLHGKLARNFASQGQQRSIVLALKLAELAVLHEQLKTPPIFLLDDVSSELDAERCTKFFQLLHEEGGQVWVTTTRSALLPLPPEAQILKIEAGNLAS